MSNVVRCVVPVMKRCRINIPKTICSHFSEEALKNIGFFCDYKKEIIILSVQRNSVRTNAGGSARICRRTKTGLPIGCLCGLQKNAALAFNLNYKDAILIKAEYDENGEGQIVLQKIDLEKCEDNKEGKYGNN